MKLHRSIARITTACVAVALCGIPEMAQAQTAQPAPAQSQQSSQPEQQSSQTPSGNDQSGTTQNAPEQNRGIINPSAGPLAPVPTNTQKLPNAPSTAQNPAQNQAPKLPPPERAPGGAAAAQAGPTAGGPASKPSGNAIAPAKQRQVRSLLIKLGAVAAAGIAIGTVVGLSKGSPSRPPGAK